VTIKTLQLPSKLGLTELIGADAAGTGKARIASTAKAVAHRIVWERVIASS
jgi:hypothetical protein